MFTNRRTNGHAPRVEDGTLGERYASIRSAVRRLDPESVAMQLPNLAETVASVSLQDESTVRFLIGVSFSKNDTLLDYRLDRLVEASELDQLRQETLKAAVSANHRYLTFAYPPDPHFDATTLRGALLGAIEGELARPELAHDSRHGAETSSGSVSWISAIRRQLVGPL